MIKWYDIHVHVYFFFHFKSDKEHEVKINEQREKQRELIHQLKSQLEDLENYAYEVKDDNSLWTYSGQF